MARGPAGTRLAPINGTMPIFIAVDRLAEREQAAKAGVTPPTRKKRETNTVNEIALVTLARLEAEKKAILATQPAKKANKVNATIGRIKSIILPALGERGIANITDDDLERFRQSHTVNGRKPKQGTISHLNSAWKEILRDAVRSSVKCPRHTPRNRSSAKRASPRANAARRSPARKWNRSAPT